MQLKNPNALPGWHETAEGIYIQDGLDVKRSIYRYMSAANINRTLDAGKLYMSNVRRWTDPFEKWWCDELLRDGSKLGSVNVYGSCWTRRRYDEPFWRLYEDRCGHCDASGAPLPSAAPPVRMKLKISRLVSHLAASVDPLKTKVFIGEVGYCSTDKIKSAAAELRNSAKQVAPEVATALHLKRIAFWFEREVRVLWIERGQAREAFLLDFPAATLVDSFMIGPTLDVAAGKALKAALVGRGVPQQNIKRSLIYGTPR
jgi:hypothetical protein